MKYKKLFHQSWFLILGFLIILFFFHRLFLPKARLFYTPDFGRSDIWNFNYPIKDFLGKSLKKGELPFWSQDVGTGFPFLAEGQIGALNIFNLILFFLFPTWLAWNLSFIIIFLTSFSGTYLFLQKNKFSRLASFLAGFVFSFSGFFISHITHFNLVQSASFLPWLFLFGQKLVEKGGKVNLFLLALVLCQQIFSGHPQITFISLVGLGLFILTSIFNKKEARKIKLKKILLFFVCLTFGFALSAPQLLPTIRLIRLSNRQAGLSSSTIFQYPYPLKHFVSFILPNYFGSPKNGSYPHFNQEWGVYWENTAYMGILPLVFLFIFFFKNKKTGFEKYFLFQLAVSILLVWGKDSPLYFIFSFPGFNFFRVPSRFLLLTTFSIAVLSAFGFDQSTKFLKKKLKSNFPPSLVCLLFSVFCLVDLFNFGFNYHPLVDVNEALKPPATSQIITQNSRIYTDPYQGVEWNKIFDAQGWKDIKPYLYFKNGLAADLNLLFDQANIEAFYGLPPARQEYYQQSLNQKLINAAGTKYLISLTQINNQNLKLIKKINPPTIQLPAYYVYKNLAALDRFRFASDYQINNTVKGFLKTINQADFNFEKTVVLEEDPKENIAPAGNGEIEILKDEDKKIVLKTKTNKKTVLVIADSFYPEWQAKIDNQKTKILPANLNQKAVILPAGEHLVELYYWPSSFYQGVAISLLSLTIFLIWEHIFHLSFLSRSSSG